MTTQNKIHRVVEQCRQSHNGPITTENELDQDIILLTDEKEKCKAIVYEIWYRKFTLLNINDSNPLFLQKNLSTDRLEINLRMLLQKCGLTLVSSVTMDDLERVILEDDPLISDDVVKNVGDETMES